MLEALKYEFSMMTRKNILVLSCTFLTICVLWIVLPRSHARYAQTRARLEQQYDGEVAGILIRIKKLYRPAGEEGVVRFHGHEVRYRFNIEGRMLENSSYIPANPDPDIRRQLSALEHGAIEIRIKYKTTDPAKNTIKLIY